MAQAPKRILVRAPNWIGDQILAFPFFHALRHMFPQAQITSVCVPWVEDVQFRNLVDQVEVVHPPTRASLWEKFRAVDREAQRIASLGEFDWGITLPNSISSAWLLKRAGVKERRGYATELRSLLLTEKVTWDRDPNRHRSQAYLDLLPGVGGTQLDRDSFWKVAAPAADPESCWPQAQALEPPEGPYYVIAPGATADSRRWMLDRFADLCIKFKEERGWTGVVVGGPKEAPLAEKLNDEFACGLKNLTAKGKVCDLWKVFRNAQVTITNESGLAHVASFCGSKVQIICGAADPRRTQPLGPGPVQVLYNPVECWPCEKNSCSQKAGKILQCLRGIDVDRVWKDMKGGFEL